MTIFIDGYNLLKTVWHDIITEKERGLFIKQMQKYARIKGHAILIVFDGGSVAGVYQESHGLVSVLYSGNYSADDIIIQRLPLSPKDNTLLVSNDRVLCKEVDQIDYVSMGVEDFYGYVQRALKPMQDTKVSDYTIIKTIQSDNQELDALLYKEQRVINKDNDRHISAYKSINKESKRERRWSNILKKL